MRLTFSFILVIAFICRASAKSSPSAKVDSATLSTAKTYIGFSAAQKDAHAKIALLFSRERAEIAAIRNNKDESEAAKLSLISDIRQLYKIRVASIHAEAVPKIRAALLNDKALKQKSMRAP